MARILASCLLVALCATLWASEYSPPRKLSHIDSKELRVQVTPNRGDPFLRDFLDMQKRLHKGGQPEVPPRLDNLAELLKNSSKPEDTERLYREAMERSRQLLEASGKHRSEGEALALLGALPPLLDGFLSLARDANVAPATVYREVWALKGAVSRVYEQRHAAARAASDPKVEVLVAKRADARRRRAELLIAPEVRDPETRKKREDELKSLDARIGDLDREIRPLLPAVARAEKLAKSTPADLQQVLPADVAVVDFLQYTHFERAKDKAGEKQTQKYTAFVVMKDKVAWVDCGSAEAIEKAIVAWREAIISGKPIPEAVSAKVRELVWEKVRKELPSGVKTVYISPDVALCRVPWAAVPGDKAGTVLLEDFAIATIPHTAFLLDKLSPQDPVKAPPTDVLVVGGVKYDAEPPATAPAAKGELPLKPNEKSWPALPGAATEASGVAGAAAKKKLPVTLLKEEKATAATVLGYLPKVRYAHLATHGFFADPSFRSAMQLDPREFEASRRGERIGRAAMSPLVMTGLVFAGANHPKTPGRGILTGEALVDLDLSGLELAVLSACETGLGDVAGGEGTFGLQRAFHLAGTRDVIASLWKIPDQPTAALMALFYRNLWKNNLSPLEALRQAQLELYRNPGRIAGLAAGFRGGFKEVPGSDPAPKPGADDKAHPLLWAAFTLSGPGR